MNRPGPEGTALVVGVGNRFRRDDGVAAAVLDELRRRRDGSLRARPGPVAELVELDGEPTRLLDAWEGRRTVVVLDAVHDPGRSPGEVLVIEDVDVLDRWDRGWSSHSGGVADALRLGRALRRLPERLVLVGVVVGDVGEGPGLSEPVGAAVVRAADAVGAIVATGSVPDVEAGEARHVPG